VSNTLTIGSIDTEFFLSIKNLFDRDPPLIRQPSLQGSVSRPGFVPTNRALYDVMGRNFRLGFRMQFCAGPKSHRPGLQERVGPRNLGSLPARPGHHPPELRRTLCAAECSF